MIPSATTIEGVTGETQTITSGARVLVRFNDIASVIVNANHGIM